MTAEQLDSTGAQAASTTNASASDAKDASRPARLAAGSRLWMHIRNGSTLAMVVVCWLALSLGNNNFLTTTNVSNIFGHASNLAIIAMALTIVLVAAEIDLSVGAIEALGAAVSGVLMVNSGLPVALAMILTVLIGALAGVVSAAIRVIFDVPSFISTLAMLSVASGLALVVTNGMPVYGLPSSFNYIGQGKVLDVPVSVIIVAGVAVALHVLMGRTKFGLHVQILGDSEWAARSVGLPVNRIRFGVLALSGGLSALAGMIVAAQIGSGNATIGLSDLLTAIAAVVIGGTSLFGGIGTIRGTILGVILIASLKNGLDLFNVQAYWQQVVIGAMIAGAVIFGYVLRPKGASADR